MSTEAPSKAQAAIWAQAQTMATITCPHCQGKAEEVIDSEAKKRAGWYCHPCKYWEKAILRETKIN